MLGHNSCLLCKTPNPYSSYTEAFENGWSKLTLRNNYASEPYKYAGLICESCKRDKVIPLFYGFSK